MKYLQYVQHELVYTLHIRTQEMPRSVGATSAIQAGLPRCMG